MPCPAWGAYTHPCKAPVTRGGNYLHDNFSEEASGAQMFTIIEVSNDLSEVVGPYKKNQFCPNSEPLPGSGS